MPVNQIFKLPFSFPTRKLSTVAGHSAKSENMKRLCQVFILLCLASVALGVFSKQIAFYGDDFVSFDLNTMPWFARTPKIMTKHIISIRFMTVQPNGMLIYMGGEEEKSDFIMINLVHGKLRYEMFN